MDLYNILWLEKKSSKDDIKKAYRKLAMKYHPDRNSWDKESEKKFKEINEAYSILSDDAKRQQYDTFWSTSWNWNPFGSGFSWWVDVDLWDIFESFFWWWWSRWTRRKSNIFKGEDIEYNINIDLKTSIYWWNEKITFSKFEFCNKCNWEWWKWKQSCNTCNWAWQVTYTSQSIFWTIKQTWTCDKCHWTWEKIETICNECHWNKRKKVKKEIDINIPAGIDNWMIIKLTSEWNDWVWTKASGDLYINFWVNLEDKWLKRKWINLYYDLEIDVIETILWTKKEILLPILWKRVIDISPWTIHWTIIKISSDWVKQINSESKWDLFIKIILKIPKKLGKRERELYEEIAKEKKINVNKSWVFKKIFG